MKFRLAGICILLAAVGISTPALAQELDSVNTTAVATPTDKSPGTYTGVLDERFYVSPMFSYLLADKDRDTKDGYGGTLTFGKGITDHLALELTGYYLQADSESSTSSGKAKLYGGGASALFFPSNIFRNVYGIVTVTYDQTKDHPGSPSSFSAAGYDAGLGYLYPIGFFGAAIRMEALFHLDANDQRNAGSGGRSEFYDGLFNVGLFIPLGRKPMIAEPAPTPVEVVPMVAAAPLDSDGDGVTDDIDQCPNTPHGTKVDSVGCPIKPPCQPPAVGERMTLSGCATGDIMVLRGVNFEFNKANLTLNAKTVLEDVADALQAEPTIKVEIGGHTDGIGSEEYNLKLSDRRAASVKEFLIKRGVAASRMTSHGYGKTRPIADNATDEGRERNRRVELTIEP